MCVCMCVCAGAGVRGCVSVFAYMCMSAGVYVCIRDCVILDFILAISENICSNFGYYIHLYYNSP